MVDGGIERGKPWKARPRLGSESLRALVRADRVHRRVYIDPDIHALEMDRIFGVAWLFVGHESQVPLPGDFVTADLAGQPILLVRGKNGAVRVMFNRCAHRGTQLCVTDRGTTRSFVCPYHGWTYDIDGTLRGIPFDHRYDAGVRSELKEQGLGAVPRVASYRGFIFASLHEQGPDLEGFLGPMRAGLDDIVDRAPEGTITFLPGTFRQEIRANWKFWVENMNDLMHPTFAHESAIKAARDSEQESRAPAGKYAQQALAAFGTPPSEMERTGVWGFPFGHSFMGALGQATAASDPVSTEYRAILEAKLGAPRAAEVLTVSRHNSMVYPSLSFQTLFQHVKVITPLAVDRSVVRVYPYRLDGAPDAFNERALMFLNLAQSPASPVQSDDFEIYRRQQDALVTQAQDWVYFARGHDQEREGEDGGREGAGMDELPMRTEFAAWLEYMTS